jgi:hypothetical protein
LLFSQLPQIKHLIRDRRLAGRNNAVAELKGKIGAIITKADRKENLLSTPRRSVEAADRCGSAGKDDL